MVVVPELLVCFKLKVVVSKLCLYSILNPSLITCNSSLITPIEDKTKVSSILAVDYLLIATFYLLLSFTGIFAFPSVPDLYTLAFKPENGQSSGNIATEIADYFLALFPVFTLSTNFPIIAITLRNNLETIITDSSSTIAALSPLARKLIFPTVAILPPVVVALATEDLGFLVSITGKKDSHFPEYLDYIGHYSEHLKTYINLSLYRQIWQNIQCFKQNVNCSLTGAYAGAGIQYVIPCALVYLSREKVKKFEEELNLSLKNPLESMFRHKGFIIMIVVWSFLSVGLVTANFILKAI